MTPAVVYDCMLFLQAASKPRRVHTTFRLLDEGKVRLCISPDVLAEVREVLTRPRHVEKFPALTSEHVDSFLLYLLDHATLVEPVPFVYTVERDPKDSKFVNLAIAAGAEFLVSWDHHLLDLMDEQTPQGDDFRRHFPTLRIIDPAGFVAIFENPTG